MRPSASTECIGLHRFCFGLAVKLLLPLPVKADTYHMQLKPISTLPILLIGMASHAYTNAASWESAGSVVLTHQATTEAHIQDESAGSADLIVQRQNGANHWVAHIEASSTPRSNGVSSILPEANADVGTALESNSKGRIQLSELYYTHNYSENSTLSAGLLDVSGFFEQSRLASDETTQFLGAFFVGNPTIEFPDYTLGVVYEAGLSNDVVLRAALASSDGLADNPERSYSQLLTVERGDGVFGIASASWEANNWLLRAGGWFNSANDQRLDMPSAEQENYGAYLLAGYIQGHHSANIRLGLANPNVSQGAGFASAAYRYQRGRYTAGVAVGRAFLSSQAPANFLKDTDQYEFFIRYTMRQGLFLTGNLQGITNSNYGELPENRDQRATVYGVRLTWLFDGV